MTEGIEAAEDRGFWERLSNGHRGAFLASGVAALSLALPWVRVPSGRSGEFVSVTGIDTSGLLLVVFAGFAMSALILVREARARTAVVCVWMGLAALVAGAQFATLAASNAATAGSALAPAPAAAGVGLFVSLVASLAALGAAAADDAFGA